MNCIDTKLLYNTSLLLLFKAEELKKLKDIEEEQGTTQEVTIWVSHLSCFIQALIFWAFKEKFKYPNVFAFQSTPPRAKYEIEAENRELSRMLEKRSQEVENLSGMALLFKLVIKVVVDIGILCH